MAFSLGRVQSQAAIPSLSDLYQTFVANNPAVASLSSAGTSEVLTANQIIAGIFVRSGGTTTTATTDTATNIVNVLGSGVYVGMTCMLLYVNLSSGTATVAAGTGVTTSGTMTVPTAGLRCFILTVTNVTTPAVTIQGAFQLGSGVGA
jgi:hypothetical protein